MPFNLSFFKKLWFNEDILLFNNLVWKPSQILNIISIKRRLLLQFQPFILIMHKLIMEQSIIRRMRSLSRFLKRLLQLNILLKRFLIQSLILGHFMSQDLNLFLVLLLFENKLFLQIGVISMGLFKLCYCFEVRLRLFNWFLRNSGIFFENSFFVKSGGELDFLFGGFWSDWDWFFNLFAFGIKGFFD